MLINTPLHRPTELRQDFLSILRNEEAIPNRFFVQFEDCQDIVPEDVCAKYRLQPHSSYADLVHVLLAS